MALLTGGTTSTTVLNGLKVDAAMGTGAANAANLASLNALIKKQNTAGMREPTAFTLQGLLYLPGGRGVIQCKPGDYIMVDPTTGWPIVISGFASSGGGYVHS